MQSQEIRHKVKQIIANVTGIDTDTIADDASFLDDLDLDSLSLLEVGVDVDYEFKLNLAEEEMKGISSVNETVQLVEQRLTELAA